MSTLDEYEQAHKWYDKVKIMALFHFKKISEGEWTLHNTADFFNVSRSTVTENLHIAANFKEVKEIGSRNKALKKLRGIKI